MKVHLLDSSEPLREGSDLTALCGAGVPKAKFAMMWNEDAMGEWLLLVRTICRDCRKLWFDKDGPRYWYGIVAGQESEDA